MILVNAKMWYYRKFERYPLKLENIKKSNGSTLNSNGIGPLRPPETSLVIKVNVTSDRIDKFLIILMFI